MINKVDKDNGFISLAIKRINPNAEFVIRNNDIDEIEWSDGTAPISKSDIQTKINELSTEYDLENYIRNRFIAYPSIQEQLDMQYWDKVNGTTNWEDAIAKVKLDNPKP